MTTPEEKAQKLIETTQQQVEQVEQVKADIARIKAEARRVAEAAESQSSQQQTDTGSYYDPSMGAWITPRLEGGVVISQNKPIEPSAQWQGGEYVEDLEGGGPAYIWHDSAGNKLATKDPNPPSTPAGLPAGTPIAPPVGGGQYYDPSMKAWITPRPGGGVIISQNKPTEPSAGYNPNDVVYLSGGEIMDKATYLTLSDQEKWTLQQAGIDEYNRQHGSSIQRLGT